MLDLKLTFILYFIYIKVKKGRILSNEEVKGENDNKRSH